MSYLEKDDEYSEMHHDIEAAPLQAVINENDVADDCVTAEYKALAITSEPTSIEERRYLRKQRLVGRTGTSGYTIDTATSFLNEIGRYPLLNGKEEERELAQAIEAGKNAYIRLAEEEHISQDDKKHLQKLIAVGELSKERFLISNVKLVVSIAKQYTRPASVDLTDIIQEGILGLEHAIDKFDYTKGFKFSTYSTNWIRQHINRFLALRAQNIKIPDKEFSSLRRAIIDFDNENRTYDKLPQKQVHLMTLINQVSLDMPIGDGESELIDVIDSKNMGPEEEAMETVKNEILYRVIDNELESREKSWLRMHFGLDGEERMSLARIANTSGVSTPTVRNAITKSLEKLRSNHNLQELEDEYL